MARYVVDCGVVLRMAAERRDPSPAHTLLAPTLLRSQALSTLHERVHAGELSADDARAQLTRINRMPIRLLGDAVLRRRAWEIADALGFADTYTAEYVALTQLQADAFCTLDATLATRLKHVVDVVKFAAIAR